MRISVLAAVSVWCGVAVVGVTQDHSVSPSPLSPQVYKNIQILKNVPANEISSSMQFMTSSLGVQCDHCHVEGAFEKDDKKPKQQAREMIKMVTALNQGALAGNRGVTCYTCHRGSVVPRRTPQIEEKVREQNAAVETSPNAGAELLKRFLQSVGGVDALKGVRTLVKKGTLELDGGIQFPIEISLKDTRMRRVAVRYPNGESIEIENGESGWSLVPGRPLHTMSAAEVRAASIDVDPFFLSRLTNAFPEVKVRSDKEINGKGAAVVRLANPDGTHVRLYFDKESGMLLRLIRYVDTPLGRNPTQIDYSDYRDVSGIKLPFRWIVAQPQGHFTVQMSSIELNPPLDDSRFAKPVGENAAGK